MNRERIPRLHLIGPLNGVLTPDSYAAVAARAAEGGVDAIHVRLPGAPGGEIMRLSEEVMARLGSNVRVTLFVNDRVDVAALVSAGGAHLGERSLPVAQARRLLGVDALIGRSVHDVRGAAQAQDDGADFVLAGHVFDTDSKPDQPGKGVHWISELTRAVTIPVIAIGGISVECVGPVIQAGAWGVAVGRELLTASDPKAVAESIRIRIEQK
ncbi:thiamine phosphate synthase [soil metagenome]